MSKKSAAPATKVKKSDADKRQTTKLNKAKNIKKAELTPKARISAKPSQLEKVAQMAKDLGLEGLVIKSYSTHTIIKGSNAQILKSHYEASV